MHVDILANADKRVLDVRTLEFIRSAECVVAVDGALDHAFRYGFKVKFVLGDLDSVSESGLERAYAESIEVLHYPEQEDTDFVKAIKYCERILRAKRICCYNVLGGERLDHTIENLRALKRLYSNECEKTIFTATEKILYLCDKRVEIIGPFGSNVAIISFDNASITSRGLEYDMTNYNIKESTRDSVCNKLAQPKAKIDVKGCVLCVVDFHCVVNEIRN
jgi:thiamine pyrophosphokinase